MKRYRVLIWDFDSRATTLKVEINENWDEEVKKQHFYNKLNTEKRLLNQFGSLGAELKILNFVDLGRKPISIVAFHNHFFEQIRIAFVMGSYYPSLTGACALGERILNHLVLLLREDYKNTPEYKKIYRKDSFDDWNLAISTLKSWNILLPKAVENFLLLKDKRNASIHFKPEIDNNSRQLALESIICLQNIISEQFSGFGIQPWFITGIPGEIYIKKEWESKPFIRKVYLDNCALVGFSHSIESLMPHIVVNDNFPYENRDISDEEFVELRLKNRNTNVK